MNASTLLTDPLFREGYDAAWAGRDCDVQSHWEQGERQSYRQGYDFALSLQDSQQPRMTLSRGGLPNSEAVAALSLTLSLSSARDNGVGVRA